MGYYTRITHSNAVIPTENLSEVYRRWCELNAPANEHLKSGGSYQGGKRVESWYSWMTSDYDKTCKTAEEILDMLGFEFQLTERGIEITNYDSKTGQEDLFFERVKDLVNGEIDWVGEDGYQYQWNFDDRNSRISTD